MSTIPTEMKGMGKGSTVDGNLLAYISFLSPIIVTFGVLFFSLLAGVVGKGCWYIMWLIVATVTRMILIFIKKYYQITNAKKGDSTENGVNMPGLSTLFNVDTEDICNKGNFLPGSNSTYSLFVLCFTFIYFMYPMIVYNNINFSVIIFFLVYIVFDILIKLYYKCIKMNNPMGAIGDLCGGFILGLVSVSIMFSTNKNVLFINELPSNKEICSMPAKQTFKCSVYKNGQVIGSSSIN
jgi:MFS family permease